MNIKKFFKEFTRVYGGMLLKVVSCSLELIQLIVKELLSILEDIKTIGIKLTK